MELNDLVKVKNHTVEEYALLIEIGNRNGCNWVRVRYFDGEEEILHPTQITPVRKDRTKNVLDRSSQ
tara:strand:+ start:177 stop:377 length:201 start_codon:yes stop_codon:yes gene_type:complete